MCVCVCVCVCTHTHSFSTVLDKGLKKNIRKKKRDGEIGKHKLNEM